MQITVFSVWMTILWSSILILIFYILRKSRLLLDVCSVSGVIVLYLFCVVRMCIPIELPWTKVIAGGCLYNALFDLYRMEIGKTGLYVNHVLLFIWILGILIILYHTCYVYRKTYDYYNQLFGLSTGKECDMPTDVAAQMGIKVKVFKSSVITVPSCIGIINKLIVLPDEPYSEEELKYIILHEYYHIRNKDALTKLLINIICAIYWWNPIVYLMRRDINQSMEIRCDAAIISNLNSVEKSNYLEIMLKIFKDSSDIKNPKRINDAVMSMLGSSSDKLMERFRLIAGKENKNSHTGVLVAWFIAVCMLLASYSFVIQPKYPIPISEIESNIGISKIDNCDTYILLHTDGSYSLFIEGEFTAIDEINANKLMDGGIKLVLEE